MAVFVALVMTTCTNRKRKPVSAGLRVSSLPASNLPHLVEAWHARLGEDVARYPAGDLYGGRGFQEADAVAKRLRAPLLIVSAGLGLVRSETLVPAYACTVLTNADDSVMARLTDGSSASDWWRAISAAAPNSSRLGDAVHASDGLVLAALSDAYIDLIAADIEELSAAAQKRLRLFTRAPLHRIANGLRGMVMPYDDRLDGPDSPVRGTRSDFAGRALRHFADHILSGDGSGDADEHASCVATAIDDWAYPERHERTRLDDPALSRLIAEHWDAHGGSSSKLLPFFRRELNIACEQGRFAALAREVRNARA